MDDAFSRDVWAAAKSRPAIEQAKGILMAYRPQNPDQAFAELAHASQQHNVKLAALTTALVHVASGEARLVPASIRDVIETHWPAMLIDATASRRTPTESDGLRA
jgi:hypothetical protein